MEMIITRLETLARPTMTTSECTCLITPKFILRTDELLTFKWDIKNIGPLPAFSLKVHNITYGKSGQQQGIDCTKNFFIPKATTSTEMEIIEGKKTVAKATYTLQVKDTVGLPAGRKLRMLIRMKLSTNEAPFFIPQNFLFMKDDQ